MSMVSVKIPITTDGAGAFTSTTTNSPTTALGPSAPYILYAVEWVKGTLGSANATLSFTGRSGVSTTLLTLTALAASGWYYPQGLVSGPTGTATTFYVAPLIEGVVKLVVSGGGATATGACILYCIDC